MFLRHHVFMLKANNICFLTLIIFLSGFWILIVRFQDIHSQKYQLFGIVVPKDENKNQIFTSFFLLNKIKNKKKIQIELNGNFFTTQKKIDLIQYEARKLKYTKDTFTVLDISLTNETNYGELLQLIKICYEDNHKMFALVKNRFIIFGEYPPVPKDTTHIIAPIYL